MNQEYELEVIPRRIIRYLLFLSLLYAIMSLYDIVGKLQAYVLLANRDYCQNIDDLKSKIFISKDDVPKVNAKSVSAALKLGGLDESEVNEFVEDLTFLNKSYL